MAKANQQAETETNFKIIGMQIDGLRKLKAINLRFNETGLTQIIGDNEQGKTTLAIDAIQILIRGNKYSNKDIVAHDRDKATIIGEVGPYKISRVIPKEGTPSLKVVDTRTGEVKTGRVQDFLDTFINELTFDPKPFLEKNKDEKLQFMMKLGKVDLSQENTEISALYEKRKLVGQEVDRYGEIVIPKKAIRISTSDIIAQKKQIADENDKLKIKYETARTNELAEIGQFNKLQRDRAEAISAHNKLIEDNNEEINDTEEKIIELKRQLDQAESWLKTLKTTKADLDKSRAKLPQPKDELPLVSSLPEPKYKSVDELDKKLAEAAEINQLANEYENQLAKQAEKSAKENEYKEYTAKIEKIRKQKLEKLSKAKFGVEGLTITEEDILYKGISSDNWSDAQGLSISRKLCIAQKPKLSAVFLDRAESMSKKTLKEFVDWAKSEGIQTIITRVVDEAPKTKEDGVYYIEEGSIIE